MAKWFIAAKKADFAEIGREFGISPVLARLIRNRDIMENGEIRKYLAGTVADLYDPYLLKDMEKAVTILAQKINNRAAIRVIGDYDVDGICATYILLRGLKELGGRADTVIPHRMKDGYGLNDNLIAAAAAAGIDTIVTCDNGIAAAPQIAAGKALGMTVIVTDHHEVPYEETEDGRVYHLPPADAVVDPKQEGCGYPFKQICGGVVAVKVIEALFIKMKKIIPPVLQEELRCLGAFATVCDVMELRDENRILVKYGLERLRETSNLGLRALIEVNGIKEQQLSPYHIGFILGPCLNATGRLDTAERALALLRAADYREAVTIAGELKNLNESRKEMTLKGVAEAMALVEAMRPDGEKAEADAGQRGGEGIERGQSTGGKIRTEGRQPIDGKVEADTGQPTEAASPGGMDKVLVLYLPDCHESLAGIIAGRIRERFGRPTFILTDGEDEVKGSGRSIDAYHMYEEMSRCKELFSKYGGHKLAAGLSMKEENIDAFRRFLNGNTALTEADFEETVHIDIALPLSYVSKELIQELNRLEPFGIGNVKPVFAQKQIRLLRGSIMGKNKNVGKYTIADGENQRYEMIYFGDLAAFHLFLSDKYSPAQVERLYAGGAGEPMEISIAYYPDLNNYMGKESIQIVMKNYC